ncbi:MAG: alginate export family protein [Bacteroidota bacterium]
MKRTIYVTCSLILLAAQARSQFKIDGQIRPRTELYNGNNNGKTTGDNTPGLATQQRSRLTFTYIGSGDTEGVKIVISPQIVSFWGQMPQAYDLLGDGAPGAPEPNFSIFEAYAQYKVSELLTLKFGRQAISYGDQRWFGALGWAASGRSHDAFVGKFDLGESSFLDVGATLNQTRHTNDPNTALQNIRAGNKSLQYAWFQTKVGESLTLPIMVTNITNQDLDDSGQFDGSHTNSTTLGVMPTVKASDVLSFDGSAYYQFSGSDISAYLLALSATYKIGGLPITFGVDMASGTDADEDGTDHTWQQPFGTNHKFYGLMDFFYVGETRKEGLNNYFIKTAIKTGEKSKLIAQLHHFTANKDYARVEGLTPSKSIGSEIDLIYNMNVSKAFNVKLGYSQFLASEEFGVIPDDDFNNWVWLQLDLKAAFFDSSKK